MPSTRLPHPVTGQGFPSPVPPGSGWPGDPATRHTPVAGGAHDVLRLAAAARTAADLDARISVCRACPRLVAWREQVAGRKRAAFAGQPYWGRPGPGFGDPRPTLLIVGLAPAAHGANRTGRMFTGDRSGDWLYAALHRAGYASAATSTAAGDGLTLSGARVVAAVRCAPPANRPAPAERACCAPWLQGDLRLAAPGLRSVLALGSLAWDAVLGAARRVGWAVPRPRPRFGHEARAVLQVGDRAVPLVGSYHPSQQNTNTGRLTESMLDAALAQVSGRERGAYR
ncbi:MAG: uracil-DNA glycosylase [Dermatophilaceae bacterium]